MLPERVQVPVPDFVIPPVPLMLLLMVPVPVLAPSKVRRKPPLAITLLNVVLPVLVTDHACAAVSVVVPAPDILRSKVDELSTPY